MPSEAVSASALLASSSPFEQKRAGLCNIVAVALTSTPALFHSIFSASAKGLEDPLVPWLWFLVILGSALTPVLHLLTDDVISGLGLDLFRSLDTCLAKLRSIGGKVDASKASDGNENETFIASSI